MPKFVPLIKEFIMIIRNKIGQSLEIIRELDKTFCEAQDKEILPLSFFSSSFDIINRLRAGIFEIETCQLQMMQDQVRRDREKIEEVNEANEIDEVGEIDEVEEEEEIEEVAEIDEIDEIDEVEEEDEVEEIDEIEEEEEAEEEEYEIDEIDDEYELAEDEEDYEANEVAAPIEKTVQLNLQATEEKKSPSVNVLADKISRKIVADFGKSLSLNDRFMFQRDLFHRNANEMNNAFEQINTFRSLDEAMDFLNSKCDIPWDSDSGIAFKELLEKRFI